MLNELHELKICWLKKHVDLCNSFGHVPGSLDLAFQGLNILISYSVLVDT